MIIGVALPFSLFIGAFGSTQTALATTTDPSKKDFSSPAVVLNTAADYTKAWYYANAMLYCFSGSPGIETDSGKVANGQLFYDNAIGISETGSNSTKLSTTGYESAYDSCGANNSALSVAAFQEFHISDYVGFVCNILNYKRTGSQTNLCLLGHNGFQGDGGQTRDALKLYFGDYISKLLPNLIGGLGVTIPKQPSSVAYVYYKATFINECTSGKGYDASAIPKGETSYKLTSLDSNDIQVDKYYIPTGNTSSSTAVDISIYGRQDSTSTVTQPQQLTCGQLLTRVNSSFSVYSQQQIAADANEFCSAAPQSYTGTALAACIDGAKNASTPNYCPTKYASNAALIVDCKSGYSGQLVNADPAGDNGASGDTVNDATTCDSTGIEGIAWLICPIMNALGGLDDAMYGWIQSVLQLNPLQQTDSKGVNTPQYENWVIIRNIANVLLVIAFLFIIFSQISSIGISNYGVKKMLPRVILVAIAINLSWFIMATAVDVVNILGVGLHTLLSATGVNASIDTLNIGNIAAALTGGTVAAGIAGITVAFVLPVAGIGAGTLILLALPFILGAALALLAAVATLFVRNALVIVLVIIAPVAIAAYLLPNTEEYFKKWRKLLISMLLLFPVAAVLFAGCKFAAYVVLTSNQPFNVIIAVFIMAAPLGLLPWLARSTGGIMDTVNKRLGGMAKSLQGSAQKGLQRRVDANKEEYKSGQRNFFGGQRRNQWSKDPNTGIETGRMTRAQKWSNRRKGLEERKDVAEKKAGSNFKEVGLGRRDETAGSRREQRQAINANLKADKVSAILDAGETEGLRAKAIGAQYEARLQGRQLNEHSPEGALTRNLEDAEATSKSFQGRLKEEQAVRIRDGAENTVAGSIGEEGILNLRDVNRAEFAAEAGAKAAESETQRANKESGADELSIQHQKEAEAGTKLVETQQEDTFKQRQADEEPLRTVVEQQDAADRSIATLDKEKEANLEQIARNDTTLEALEKRKQEAEARTEVMHDQEAAELAARRSPTGGPGGGPGDLYGLTRDQEEAKLQKEKAEKEQERVFQERQTPADDKTGKPAGDLAGIRADIDQSGVGADTAKSQQEAALAKRKEYGGDLFDSAAAGAAAKATATASGKRFDSTVKELATKDTKKRKLRDILLGKQPDPDATKPDGTSLYPGGINDPEYQKAMEDYDEKARQFEAANEGGLRQTLQDAATEDYIASSRITQAEAVKTLGLDDEMQKDNTLVADATGVGTQKRVRAGAAKRLRADREGDVGSTEDILENNATSRDESLALLGKDIYGESLFDDEGNFIYQGESPEARQAVWRDYVEGRRKIGQPLDPATYDKDGAPKSVPNDIRQLDSVEQEALLRRTIKQGDKKANVRPTLAFLRENVLDAKAKKAEIDARPGATEEEKEDAEQAVNDAVRLQASGIQQYSSTPGALSPFLSSGDQGAMVDGTFEREPDDLVINTFGSEKLGDPGFAAKWNIDHYKEASSVFEELGKPPDKVDPEIRQSIDAQLATRKNDDGTPSPIRPGEPGYEDAFLKARVDKHFDAILAQDGYTVPPVPSDTAPQADKDAYQKAKERQDKERTKRMQSLSDSRKGIDQVDDNEAFKPDGRAHEQIYKIRNVMDRLEAAHAIPEVSPSNGEPYMRKSYTDEPGVAETTPTGQQVYLQQVSDPANPKGFIQQKYILAEDGSKVPYTSTAYTQQPPAANVSNTPSVPEERASGTATSADDLIIPRS